MTFDFTTVLKLVALTHVGVIILGIVILWFSKAASVGWYSGKKAIEKQEQKKGTPQ